MSNVNLALVPRHTSKHGLARLIRDVPDFPKPGVTFKDVTPLLADPGAFAICIDALISPWRARRIDTVLGIEARGFIFGAAMAHALDAGFVPLCKAGRLPAQTVAVDYDLEYGEARLEAHADALEPGARVLIVDDVLATGGTLEAARQLALDLDAEIAGACVVIELTSLGGRERWRDRAPLHALLRY
ncbi:MAG: adenine phosphoribosyltransferase [Rhodanobacteraceae bacterium]